MTVEPTELNYHVEDMSCGNCKAAVTEALTGIAGVTKVKVDLDTKLVRVEGTGVDDAAVRSAIDEAGYVATQG